MKAVITVLGVLPLLLVTACATTQGRRESNAPVVRTTSKSFASFESCFASSQEKQYTTPTFTPKEHGGTFSNNATSTGLALYVVDIIDTGPTREIKLYAKGGIYGSRTKMLAVIERCL